MEFAVSFTLRQLMASTMNSIASADPAAVGGLEADVEQTDLVINERSNIEWQTKEACRFGSTKHGNVARGDCFGVLAMGLRGLQ